jgi:4-hydroxy-3-methylbut-2-enyl diphosphate reductase
MLKPLRRSPGPAFDRATVIKYRMEVMHLGETTVEKVVLAEPRGFCAGVERAVEAVRNALKAYGPPLYVRHQIVHNRFVLEALETEGAIFVESLDCIPNGQRVIFSAHGVAPSEWDRARERELRIIDATCPLVTKVHLEALRYAKQGYSIVLIGHRGHVEVEGTLGEAPDAIVLVESVADVEALDLPDPTRVAYISQTTLSVDDVRAIVEALRRKYPAVREPTKADICYATQNRQDAVKELARRCHVVLVVGAPTSSNANRLVEVAASLGAQAHLIESADDIQAEWIDGDVGITAGASTPEEVVQDCISHVQRAGGHRLEEFRLLEERVMFPLPGELLVAARDLGIEIGAGNERAAARAGEFRIRHH